MGSSTQAQLYPVPSLALQWHNANTDKIENNKYDNFNKRAYTAKWEKLLMLPRSFLQVKGILPSRFADK